MTTEHEPLERIPPRREIVTDQFPPDGGYTVPDAGAHVRAAHTYLDTEIESLRCLIGWRRMDALLSGVNAFGNALRNEMIARLIAAAADVRDWRIDAFIVPEAGGASDDEGDADATP